jgi:flagellar biosynthesis/type III secretory pathway protein FliH
VREALAQAEETAELQIQLNPQDLEVLRQADSSLLDPHGAGTKIIFIGAAEVSRGGCLARTRFGTIDTRRETKLELIRQSLAETLAA